MITRRVAIVLATTLFVGLAACGSDGGDQPAPAAGGTTAATPSSDPAEASPSVVEEEPDVLEVWFVKGDRLWLSHVSVPSTQAPARAAMESLLTGPQEGGAGVGTAIPGDTELLDISISGQTATVDLSSAFESGGGSASMFARLAQVVFTVTQFPTVAEVIFRVEGEEVETFSSEGIVLDGPQSREDYEDQMPAIVVTSPRRGQTVGTTVTVAGTANVFEATVSIRVVSDSGEVLAETFTTATCGTGCRGDYSVDVPLEVSARTEAIVWVFESSAEDGRPTKVVKVPVTIEP
jgi:germination protein M